MNKISVTVITKNCATSLSECIKSVLWADEIIVVDQGSTDGTIEICSQLGAKVIQSEWLGFGLTKQLAVEASRNSWVLSIDSDEVCSPALQSEIASLSDNMETHSAFKIKRINYFLGVPIRYSGWQNDFPVRLFRKDMAGFNDKPVHEYVEAQGTVGTISAPILHHSFPTYSSFIQKTDTYSSLSAQISYEKGKKASLAGALAKSIYKFVSIYIFRLGFLDGAEGLVLARSTAFSVYVKYIKINELYRLNSQLLSNAKK